MASRKEQKEAARQRRLAEEQAAARKQQRTRRLQMLGGAIVAAIIVVVVLVVVSSGGGSGSGKKIDPVGPQAKQTEAAVTKLLKGIPQSGNTLGNPHARVTVTEYGDLVCPICREFALGAEQQLIANQVKAGKVKIVYRALETASGAANNAMFVPGQTSALAAGRQKLGWNYIETFYHEQQSEDDSYVTTGFLQALAKQIPGLNYARWNSERSSASLSAQVTNDESTAQRLGFSSTPSIVVQGPVSQAKPIVGAPSYPALESTIKSVY